MFTSIVGVAARSTVATVAATARLSSRSSQLLVQNVPVAAVRPFTVSAWSRAPAAKASAPKKTTAASTKAAAAAAAAKKPAAKKKPAATKKATKPKAKKAVKPKAAPKKRVKKVLTIEEKEKLNVKELKKWAMLSKIPSLPDSAWIVFTSKHLKDSKEEISTKIKEIAAKYRDLSDAEREDLVKTAQANRAANEVTYKAWVEEHPVERIYLANQARRRLARKLDKTIKPLNDERLPKNPGNAYSSFVKERYTTVDSDGSLPEVMKALSDTWKNLPAHEKSAYESASATEIAKYNTQVEKIKAKVKDLLAAFKEEERIAAEAKAKAKAEARAKAKAAKK